MTKLRPKDTTIFTRNPWTKKCFEKIGVKVKNHPMFFNKLSATKIRTKINKNLKWENWVPKEVSEYLREKNLLTRFKVSVRKKIGPNKKRR